MADKRNMVLVRLQADGESRTEQFMGRQFRVIPAVLVRSQVLRNNLGATFLPAEDITNDWADAWNGIPVLIGPHPTERGKPVSGRTAQLWDSRGAGWIFNARADQESAEVRRLKGEVWLDEGRADAVQGLKAVLERVGSGEPVELSTGFAAQIVNQTGEFQGEQFEIVMHPLGPDHLVVSTEFTGACGVHDGCGLGVNQEETPKMEAPKTGLKAVLERAGQLFGTRQSQEDKVVTAFQENVAYRLMRETEALNATVPSDQDRANMVRDALQAKVGNSDKYVVLMDVYTDGGLVVFYFSTPFGPEPKGAEFYRCTFTVGEGGTYAFGEPERVRRMTTYDSVTQQTANAANAAGNKPCGCHKEAENMQDNEKKEIVNEVTTAVTNALKGLIDPLSQSVANVAAEAKTAAEGVVNAAVAKFETAVATLTAKVDAVVNAAQAEEKAEKDAIVAELSSNNKTVFTKEELDAQSLPMLRKIATQANVEVTSYGARGSVRTPAVNASAEPAFAEPVSYAAKPAANTDTKPEAK